jgi:molybdopterin-guanine dinucleotide biosynthesis protein A
VAAWVRGWLERRRRLGGGVIGAILVGGRSRRMGADKARMRVGGQPVLSYLAELLGERLEEVWVVGRPVSGIELPQCVHWHLDLRAGCGPLGGIATALRIAGAGAAGAAAGAPGNPEGPRAALIVACDMPFLNGRTLELLLEHRRADRLVSVLRNPVTGHWEPLAAVYEPGALREIEEALDGGMLSVTSLLESLGSHVIEAPPEIAGCLANVNTPQELGEVGGELEPL